MRIKQKKKKKNYTFHLKKCIFVLLQIKTVIHFADEAAAYKSMLKRKSIRVLKYANVGRDLKGVFFFF